MEFEQVAGHAAELIHSLPKGERIRIISHCDADGIASAAIMAISLARAGYRFHISIKKTGPGITDGIGENELAIFCDIGSTNLEELNNLKCRVILCDHHMIKGELTNGI
ncbi:MAG TPA: DHH family phosphoesterase, partial [Thermoplasmatales archaeon]|nr:DHH family phosphoesterase [Thermoplasmatales archaeon]